ncbi:MAG: imidazole glycerol phosphate synthase subunit HisF [Candidatus Omnitrophota bacterium]
MSVKKIIPCLDFKGGRVVKGVNFVNLKDAGDPVENAKVYNKEGADELVFLDIAASVEKRKTMVESARRVAEKVTIPFTVGGGIGTLEDIENLLKAGCAKISINTAAVKKPQFLKEASAKFGKERIVVAIDVKKKPDNWEVYVNGGQVATGLDAVEWAREAASLGAGEILLTSMDRDGTKDGYDIEITRKVAEAVDIPVTASGGCGKLEDFYKALTEGKAEAALAASVFHFREFSIKQVKDYLRSKGVAVK